TDTHPRADYSIGQKVLHWLIAAAIMLDLYIAQKFSGIMTDADRFESRSDHASLGTIVAILFVIRLYLRWKNGAAALPAEMPLWQKWLSHFAHWALYFLIGMLIITGMAAAVNANSVVEPFGLFAFGDGAGNGLAFYPLRGLHELATNLIIGLIALHVVGALYHLVFVRDGVTGKMLKFWKSEA
ncbi:cytochrome b, partial [Sulfitobacter sp.]|uniref:cytochrome b n=1 Tax=Sulfitobacter sp. TaxID=1903071 RepID=UPI003EF51A08